MVSFYVWVGVSSVVFLVLAGALAHLRSQIERLEKTVFELAEWADRKDGEDEFDH